MALSRRFALALVAAVIAACARGTTPAGGGAPSPAMPDAKPEAPALPAGVTVAMIALGDSLYSHNACQRCHGPYGFNGPNGPALAKGDSAKWLHSDGSYEGIVATIIAGVPQDKLVDKTRRFAMRPRGSNPPLDDTQIRAIAAYIWKLNHK
jgi:mono/diheme cytochrome c family protein